MSIICSHACRALHPTAETLAAVVDWLPAAVRVLSAAKSCLEQIRQEEPVTLAPWRHWKIWSLGHVPSIIVGYSEERMGCGHQMRRERCSWGEDIAGVGSDWFPDFTKESSPRRARGKGSPSTTKHQASSNN